MQPKLARGELVGKEKGPNRHVDQIGKNGSEKQKTNVNLWVPENPAKQPEAGPKVPEEHGSGNDNASTVDAAWQVVSKGLVLLSR